MRFVNESPEAATIEIYGTIGGWDPDKKRPVNTISSIAPELERLKNIASKTIEVKINSYGGDINHALAIHDALKDHTATITTIMNGYCASAATIIAMAGTVRKISRNALFLIHKCSSYTYGNENDLAAELESQRTTNEVILNIYRQHCTKSADELDELFNANNGNGKWITAQEAFEWGFATEIYNDGTSAKVALLDHKILDAYKLPPLPEGWCEPEEKPSFYDRVMAILRDLYGPTKPTNNNNTIMKNINDFTKLCTALNMQDVEFDPETGIALNEEQLKAIEEQLANLETQLNDLKRELEELKAANETLTTERDDFKQKYENMPAPISAVSGSDQTDTRSDFERYMDESPAYKEADKYL